MGIFHNGDTVRIRDWNDMAYEYGEDDWGDINFGNGVSFVSGMRGLCGKEFKIIDISNDGFHVSLNGAETKHWSIIPLMLEKVEEYEVDNSSLDDFLKAYHRADEVGDYSENGMCKMRG